MCAYERRDDSSYGAAGYLARLQNVCFLKTVCQCAVDDHGSGRDGGGAARGSHGRRQESNEAGERETGRKSELYKRDRRRETPQH